ncbi:MAG TPA: cobalamin-independent methionine synthase II family protein [candidate division Zixibacteria bacterium]|nr:cobalamin-independent methionine synthase II family protein [candidate division Zixibacteria bacterium]
MRRSTERILTTHVGSLPRPDDLREMWSKHAAGLAEEALEERLRSAVAEVVRAQVEAGIDIPNDGEFGKPMRAAVDRGAWGNYVFHRLSGFIPTPPEAVAPDTAAPGAPMRIVGVRWEQREFAQFYADTGLGAPSTAASRPTCAGPVAYVGHEALSRDLANLRAAADKAGIEEAFVSAIAPGSLEMFCRGQNLHYPTPEAFVAALASAMREEYRAIVRAGFVLQIDDPGLPGAWDMLDPRPSIEAYRRYARLRVEALNGALEGIPEDRVRYHICWGSWHGPHTTDIPLREVVDVMLEVKAQAYLVEAGNARHEHEYKVWRDVRLPQGKILIPGVVSHATNVVEHPELVADRIAAFADIVGRENVIAGTDCGLGGRVHPQIAWAKLRALSEGAALASRRLRAR